MASSADVAQAEAQYKSTQAQLIEAGGTSRAQLEHALPRCWAWRPRPSTCRPPASAGASWCQPSCQPSCCAGALTSPPPSAAWPPPTPIWAWPDGGFSALTLSGAAGYRGARLSDLVSALQLFWSLACGPGTTTLFDGGRATRPSSRPAPRSIWPRPATARKRAHGAAGGRGQPGRRHQPGAQQQQVQAEAVAAAQGALDVVSNQYRAGTVAYLNVPRPRPRCWPPGAA